MSKTVQGISAYPLQWPAGWPRTKAPKAAPFRLGRKGTAQWNYQGAATGTARDNLMRELQLLGARKVVLSTNVELRLDGLPYAGRRSPDDAGVAVYFELDGAMRCIPCDRWNRVGDNMHAIGLTVSALRGLDRWGTHRIVEAAFTGFRALPPAAGPTTTDAAVRELETLSGMSLSGADLTEERLRSAIRKAAVATHPETGGDEDRFRRFTLARDVVRQQPPVGLEEGRF